MRPSITDLAILSCFVLLLWLNYQRASLRNEGPRLRIEAIETVLHKEHTSRSSTCRFYRKEASIVTMFISFVILR
jgi:hypothetical protein